MSTRKPPVSWTTDDIIPRRPVVAAPLHTRDAFNPKTARVLVERAAAVLEDIKPEGILVCGHSGLALGGALSYVTNIPLIAVRKWGEAEQTRSMEHNVVSAVLCDGAARRWVFLDDFLSSGKTLSWAVRRANDAKCIVGYVPTALLLYRRRQEYTTQSYALNSYNYDDLFPHGAECPMYGLEDNA